MNYLGVVLDPKLNWKTHLEDKSSTSLCGFVESWAGTEEKTPRVGGGGCLVAKQNDIITKIDAAIIWWPKEKVEARNLLKSLRSKITFKIISLNSFKKNAILLTSLI